MRIKPWTMSEAESDAAEGQAPRRSVAGLLAHPWIAGQEGVTMVVVLEGAVVREVSQVIGNDGVQPQTVGEREQQ